ncbi:LysR family transcriptional regulator [Amycolatopsis sp. cg5]|uniref:LysR family transcriptional regulator n=1 Tax=Amycolatopsis sp. cg5 TaxID=3238802 RepID=UPI00352399EB
MEARQLEYFLAVVDQGGINAAARALHLAQPSLSQAIRALERDLGSNLFHRVGRKVMLTEAGHALIEPARQVVHGMDFARASVESVAGLTTGRVEIATMPSQSVEPLSSMISRFTARRPGVSVVVRAAFTAKHVIDMVRTGIAEIGMLGSSEPTTASGILMTPVSKQRFVLVVPPDNPFPAGAAVGHEQLSGQRVIVGQEGTGMRRLVDEIRAAGVDLTIAIETEYREAILPLVLKGAGMAILTDAWTTLAESAGAKVLQLDPPAYLHIALARRIGPITPAAREFLSAAVDRPKL